MRHIDEYHGDEDYVEGQADMIPLAFYDVMAEDMYITATRVRDGIETTVTNERDEVVFHEVSHEYAWDSLVYFAKQILSEDAKIERQREARE